MPYGATTCPSCGLSLQGPTAARLFVALTQADQLLAELRAKQPVAATASGPAAARGSAPTPTPGLGEPPAPLPPRPKRGLSAASVPRILLGLGALCLLIAALVFLAVTWSVLGVAGRTAILLGFTALAGGLAAWAAQRNLRAAAESLSLVALGLLAFDLFGARDSGWFGNIGTGPFFVVLGAVLVAAGAAAALAVRRAPARTLVGAQVVAALGLFAMVGGLVSSEWFAGSAALTVSVLLGGALTAAAHSVRLMALLVGSAAVTGFTWLLLLASSLERALSRPTARELWLDLEIWPLLASAALVGAVALVPAATVLGRVAALAIAEVVLVGALLIPFWDAGSTSLSLAVVVAVAATGAVTWSARTPWTYGLAVTVGLAGLFQAGLALSLAVEALARLAAAGALLWTGTTDGRLPALRGFDDLPPAPWLLPLAVLAAIGAFIVLARAVPLVDRVVAPLADLTILVSALLAAGVLTVALYPVPVAVVVTLLLACTTGLGILALRTGWITALGATAVFLFLAVVAGLHDDELTLTVLVVALGFTVAVYLRWTWVEISAGAGFLLSLALGGLAWTVGSVAEARATWTALAGVLLLVALVLAGPYGDERLRRTDSRLTRLSLELGALLAAGTLAAAGIESAVDPHEATWTAVYLTVVGAAVSAMALQRSDRRQVGWLGGFLLAAASWVRLWDVGVETPEAYTLPSAVALGVVGVLALRRNPGEATMTALSPALALGLVPSLLWVLWDPVTLRSVLLGVGCLALVVVGLRLRWTAPVVFAATVGSLLILRHATPVAEAVPRWVLIGGAGALLIAMGITWERRLQEARAVVGFVRGLR